MSNEWKDAIDSRESPCCGADIISADVTAFDDRKCKALIICESCNRSEVVVYDCLGSPRFCGRGVNCNRYGFTGDLR